MIRTLRSSIIYRIKLFRKVNINCTVFALIKCDIFLAGPAISNPAGSGNCHHPVIIKAIHIDRRSINCNRVDMIIFIWSQGDDFSFAIITVLPVMLFRDGSAISTCRLLINSCLQRKRFHLCKQRCCT